MKIGMLGHWSFVARTADFSAGGICGFGRGQRARRLHRREQQAVLARHRVLTASGKNKRESSGSLAPAASSGEGGKNASLRALAWVLGFCAALPRPCVWCAVNKMFGNDG